MAFLRRIEFLLVLLATLIAVYFHLSFFRNAGGLWRDEINSISIANLSSVADIWRHIEFDSFPMLWLLVLRTWSFVVGTSDLAYRFFGLGIGISILAVLWFNARTFKITFPTISIALLGFSPAIIRWSDSIRGYGLGICAILLTFGLVWKVLERPNRRNTILAIISALIAVQTLYYNAVLVFAICVGGFVLIASNRAWRRLPSLIFVGGVAALSLTPYLAVFQRSKSWGPIFQYPEYWHGFQLSWFWQKLTETLNSAGGWAVWVWVGVFIFAIAGGILCLTRRRLCKVSRKRSNAVVYSLVALLVGAVGYYLFLKRLQYLTQPWYYIGLLAFSGLACEILISGFDCSAAWRIGRICFLLTFAVLSFWPVRVVLHTRMTNIDLVANWLEKHSTPGDIILVTPWYCGISFSRYYHGPTAWMTIPPIDDYRYHRVDLLQKHMTAVDQSAPLRPVFDKIKEALQSGHRVWMFGHMAFPVTGQVPILLLSAPNEKSGWHDGPYYGAWSMQVAYFVQRQSAEPGLINFQLSQRVSEYENLPLYVAEQTHSQ